MLNRTISTVATYSASAWQTEHLQRRGDGVILVSWGMLGNANITLMPTAALEDLDNDSEM
jgi:hypothetical protein